MSDRDRMQGAREWHSSRDSERRREDEDRHRRERERERGDEWRRDNPERYRDWRERDDSLGNGQRGSYGGHNNERSYGDDGWRGGGYGSSSDNPRREYPGAPRHVKQDARLSEQQRAEEERRAQVARELQQVKKRKEEEEYAAYMCAERAKQVAQRKREEERRNAKRKHGVEDETREDFPKAREERDWLVYWLTEWRGRGDGKPLLPAGMDHEDVLENIHRFYTVDADFSRIGVLHARIQDYMLLGDGLFGQKLSSDAKEIADFLKEKSSGGTRRLEGRDVAVKRLVECAKRKGWLVELAGLLVKDAKKIELVDKAAGESSTFEDVCMAFDKNTEKANGQPLWSLSKETGTNLATFRNTMMPAMKLKFPKSRGATRVLEVANNKGWLERLARYAADKVADDAGDEDDDMPNMSRR